MSDRINKDKDDQRDREAVKEETRRIRKLQRVVALAQQTIATQVRTKGEALAVVDGVREYALKLFPDGGDTFDLIYRPRLLRIYRDRFEGGSSAETGSDG